MPVIRIEYVNPHDAQIAAVHTNLVSAVTAMNDTIVRVNQLHHELPRPESFNDAADQAHEALDGIVVALCDLDSIIRRAARWLS